MIWLHERHSLDMNSSENAAVIVRLQAIVDRYAQTKVPQATADPSCPQLVGTNVTISPGVVKLVILPWCD